MKKAELVMMTLFQIQTSLKFSHWRTKSYSKHKALDKFMKKYLKRMDEFIEVWQGKYGRIVFSEKEEDVSRELKVYQLNENELQRYLDCVKGFLIGKKNKECSKYNITNKEDYCKVSILDIVDKDDTDMLNIRDELLGLINHLKYLLTLV